MQIAVHEVFFGATRLASAASTKPPDLSGGPLGCFSVFCPPGLAPRAAKAVAGVLLAMIGVRADPPKVHRREVHSRSQFAPDLATWIKLALFHLRQYRAADTRLLRELPLGEAQPFPVVEHHPGQCSRFVFGAAGLVRLPTENALFGPPRFLRRISHARSFLLLRVLRTTGLPSWSYHDHPTSGLRHRVPPHRRPGNTRILQKRSTNGQFLVEIWSSNGLQMVQFRYTTGARPRGTRLAVYGARSLSAFENRIVHEM